jgi:hypothetical protein
VGVTPDIIHEAVAHGRISEEQGARMLELHYEIVKIARRTRWRIRIKRWLLWWR